MKVLITGGAGFIGSSLVDRLLTKYPDDFEILVIDNFTTGRRDNLTPHKKLIILEGDIQSPNFCSTSFEFFKPDVVVHAAASYKDPNDFYKDAMTNVIGTINVINECKKADVDKIIYFQTSLCYGLKPIEQPITIHHPLFSGKSQGGSSYAISKTAAEQYIELSGIPFFSFRLANAFGPRNLSGPVPTFYNRITKNLPITINNTRRDFIFVDDLIDVVEKAIIDETIPKGYYHISTGRDFSIEYLFNTIVENLRLFPPDVTIKDPGEDDVKTILLDPKITESSFDWQAKTKFEDGIEKAINWYMTHEISETFTHLKMK